ncbi:glycosyltransferase family 2 protein [Acholeplasma equifetale]|uniref:glycosyltransferase family 2 protein n=1 Tax=Acholeplasma equifetale TaxID=264634 RepID=UPI00138AC666|nr:glycosyltransferase family 2 protein [Acholeplasma equifetale]
MELVSVIIPTYNVEKYINDAMDSIINQTYKNLEIIVVDDCSTDETYNILKTYKEKDTRLKLFRNETNQKIVYTLNKAVSYANGQYICRMDGDDISELDRIERMVKFIKENPKYDLVGCSVYSIDEKGEILSKKRLTNNPKVIEKTIKYQTPVLHIWLAKKEVYDNIKYRSLLYAEDYDFLLRVITKGYQIGNISNYYGYYVRLRSNNTQSYAGIYQRKSHAYCYKLNKKERKQKSDLFDFDDFIKYVTASAKEKNNYIKGLQYINKAKKSKSQFKKTVLYLKSMFCSKEHYIYYMNRIKYEIILRLYDRKAE